MNGDVFMKDKEVLNESNFYGQVLEEEKNVDISKPCAFKQSRLSLGFMWIDKQK